MKGIWTYQQLLPHVDRSAQITMGEGHTPLVRSRHIGPALGFDNLYFKLENLNPTGSYKDRFAALAVSKLMEQGHHFCLATSSGNTGAALAAYCAAAQIRCLMAIVDGAPRSKLQQMQLYGAATLMIKGFGKSTSQTDRVMTLLNDLAKQYGAQVQISAFNYCPDAMQGVQTIAYEIAETLGRPADILVPAGGGGLTLAIARGFKIWEEKHNQQNKNRVHCVQPAGNDTIATALADGATHAASIKKSKTHISGLQVPNILDGTEVIQACRQNGGTGITVSDAKVWQCQQWLATKEGIYCEPAGAVALAGAVEAMDRNLLPSDRPIVCIVTGHGFKDMEAADQMAKDSTNAYLESTEAFNNYIQEIIKQTE